MLKRFNQIMGINSTLEEAREQFSNRIVMALSPIIKHHFEIDVDVIEEIAFELGVDPHKYKFLGWELVIKNSMLDLMKFTSALYSLCKRKEYDNTCKILDHKISDIIKMSTTDLGIRWVEGYFYPDEIPEIDATVIDETLKWLNNYPAVKLELHNALVNVATGRHDQVLGLCYQALENVVKVKTGKKGALSDPATYKDLFSQINVSEQWRSYLGQFVKYANDFGRHGNNPDRHNVDADEVESYLYLTFIMIRMIIRKIPG